MFELWTMFARLFFPAAPPLLALCVQVGDALSRALGALHARDLSHGDVKPDNVIVQRGDDGRLASCKLVDFGLARAFGAAFAAGAEGSSSRRFAEA